MKRWYLGASALVACTWLLVSARVNPPRVETNSLGMKLVRIESWTFTMGMDSAPLPAELLEGKAGVKGREGMLTDWGAHHLDIIHWAMGVDAPSAVYATGGKFVLKDNRETPDTLLAVWEYPGFTATYTTHAVNARRIENRPYGIRFCGTLGTLIVDRSSYEVVPEMKGDSGLLMPDAVDRLLASLRGERPQRVRRQPEPLCAPMEETKISIDPSAQEAHVRNFLECIRSRENPVADVEIGHRSATACLLGAIAFKVGRRVRWDGKSERILDDAQAHRLLTKQYRAPWHLPQG